MVMAVMQLGLVAAWTPAAISRHDRSCRPLISIPPISSKLVCPFFVKRDEEDDTGNETDDRNQDMNDCPWSNPMIPSQYQQEEILLQIQLDVVPTITNTSLALTELTRYTQQFPFAVVLPVQPLFYFPTTDGGVEIRFLRKKTDLKSSHDGGIRFFLQQIPPVLTNDDDDDDVEEDKEPAPVSLDPEGVDWAGPSEPTSRTTVPPPDTESTAAPQQPTTSFLLTARRNSVGQTVPKMFAEKQVITAFLQSLTRPSDPPSTIVTHHPAPPTQTNLLTIRSIFHKWMSTIEL